MGYLNGEAKTKKACDNQVRSTGAREFPESMGAKHCASVEDEKSNEECFRNQVDQPIPIEEKPQALARCAD